MIGHSECSVDILDGPAISTAVIRGDKVAEWRVYDDTEENRREFQILWRTTKDHLILSPRLKKC